LGGAVVQRLMKVPGFNILFIGVVLACALWPMALNAMDSPQPPCGDQVMPPYSGPNEPPAIQVWTDGSIKDWVAPSCTGWTDHGFRILVALAATFPFNGEAKDLLGRFGAVSSLRGIRYWSVMDQSWRVLITDASVVDGTNLDRRRSDLTADELQQRKTMYFLQQDTRFSGPVIYRLHVLESAPARLVLEVENVSPMRSFSMTLFGSGDLQFIYFLDRHSPGLWELYSLLRTKRSSSSLTSGHKASYVNRAVAYYRYLVGIPTDQNPPAVRSE
jgi:uncharacterized protein DUF6675